MATEHLLREILDELKEQTRLQGALAEKVEDLTVEIMKRFPCGEKAPEEIKENMERMVKSFEGTPVFSILKNMMGGAGGK